MRSDGCDVTSAGALGPTDTVGLEAVAGGQAAGGVEEHRLDRGVGMGPGVPDARRPGLVQPVMLERPSTAWPRSGQPGSAEFGWLRGRDGPAG